MVALLVSYACDRCASAPIEYVSRGYAILDLAQPLPVELDVLLTRTDAERWRDLSRLSGDIVQVGARHEIYFRPSRGTVQHLIMADRMYEIVDDPTLDPKPNRAWRIA